MTAGQDADLVQAALLIAKLDNEELDIQVYKDEIERMANEIKERLDKSADPQTRLSALNKYLFEENGFHGSRTNYYQKENSYLSSVLDDREGLPVLLSVLYMELGRRLGLTIEGIGLPGHFVVRHVTEKGNQLIDVFDGGRPMTRDEAELLVLQYTGQRLSEEHLRATTKKEIVLRMLGNLFGLVQDRGDPEAVLPYLEAMLAVDPDLVQQRLIRAVARCQSGRRTAGLADFDWLLERQPPDIDLEKVHQARQYFLHH